jgi:hypothetical protein
VDKGSRGRSRIRGSTGGNDQRKAFANAGPYTLGATHVVVGSAGGAAIRGTMATSEVTAAGVARAMDLAADALRLSTATPAQLETAVAFLARARARFPDSVRGARRFDAVERLEAAGQAIGAELRRRAEGAAECHSPRRQLERGARSPNAT